MTRAERMPPATSIARDSRVNSSMTVRHFSDPVPLGHLGHRGLVRLAQDRHHLLFFESRLLHGSSLPGKGHLL